jgi:hypothetical protein
VFSGFFVCLWFYKVRVGLSIFKLFAGIFDGIFLISGYALRKIPSSGGVLYATNECASKVCKVFFGSKINEAF